MGIKIDDLQIGQAIHIRELIVPEGVKAAARSGSRGGVQIKMPAASSGRTDRGDGYSRSKRAGRAGSHYEEEGEGRGSRGIAIGLA